MFTRILEQLPYIIQLTWLLFPDTPTIYEKTTVLAFIVCKWGAQKYVVYKDVDFSVERSGTTTLWWQICVGGEGVLRHNMFVLSTITDHGPRMFLFIASTVVLSICLRSVRYWSNNFSKFITTAQKNRRKKIT